MALKYKDSKYLDYSGALLVTSSIPLDIRGVVANEENLIAAETWYQDGSTATGVKIAYRGMLVSVEDTNTVYMCIDPTNITSLTLGWKKINPDLDISGKMIDVIEYNNEFYDKADGAGDPWEPNPDAESIVDPQVTEEGKYLCLVLNDTDKVYIKSTDLIDLTDYYTKVQVDEKINALDSSVSIALDGIREYVDTLDDILEEKINALDSSLTLLKEYVDEQDTSIKNYVDSENDKINQRIDSVDASITKITNEITNFINTVEEKFDEIDTSLNNLTDDLSGVHEALSDIEERHEADIEELKSVDTSLDNKIEDVSLRLSQLEVGTVDSISTDTPEYLIIDTSKGDVTINIDASTSTDSEKFPNTALVTNGYIEEKMAWIEVDE